MKNVSSVLAKGLTCTRLPVIDILDKVDNAWTCLSCQTERERERWNKGLPYAARGDNEDEIRIVEGWCVVKRGPIDQRGCVKTLPGLPLQDTRLDSFASALLRTASNPPPHPRLRFYLQGGWNHPNSFIHSHRVRERERERKKVEVLELIRG